MNRTSANQSFIFTPPMKQVLTATLATSDGNALAHRGGDGAPPPVEFDQQVKDEVDLVKALYGVNELVVETSCTSGGNAVMKLVLAIENTALRRTPRITVQVTSKYPAFEPPQVIEVGGLEEEEEAELRQRLCAVSWSMGELVLVHFLSVVRDAVDGLFDLVKCRTCKICFCEMDNVQDVTVVSCPRRHIFHSDCWKGWTQSSMTTESKIDKVKAYEMTRDQISRASENDLKLQLQKIQALDHAIAELDQREKVIRARLRFLNTPQGQQGAAAAAKRKRAASSLSKQRQENDDVVDDVVELERRMNEIKDSRKENARERKAAVEASEARQVELEHTMAKLRVQGKVHEEKLAMVRCPMCQEVVTI